MSRWAMYVQPDEEDEAVFFDTVGCADAINGLVKMSSFRHGPLSSQAECEEWIATTIRKLPRGALARLYRILYEGEGLRIESAKREEEMWRKNAPKT